MNIKKSLLVAGAAATIGVAGLSGLGVASAATTSNDKDSLASKIATKFGLKEAEVQAVFDEEKAERQAELEAEVADRLQGAVDEGKITAAQKTLIENKLKELEAAREAEREALEEWAKANGVDAKFIMVHKVKFAGGEKSGKMMPGDTRLQDAVDDGDLTADQKAAIEAKQKELQDKREADREALQKWAEDNNIDASYLKMAGPRMIIHDKGGPF